MWRHRPHVAARLMENRENKRVRRRRMVVEGVDASVKPPGHLPNGVEDGRLEDAHRIFRPHGSPKTSPSIAGFGEELAPPILGGEQCGHFVDLFERIARHVMPVVVERHGLLHDRGGPPGATCKKIWALSPLRSEPEEVSSSGLVYYPETMERQPARYKNGRRSTVGTLPSQGHVNRKDAASVVIRHVEIAHQCSKRSIPYSSYCPNKDHQSVRGLYSDLLDRGERPSMRENLSQRPRGDFIVELTLPPCTMWVSAKIVRVFTVMRVAAAAHRAYEAVGDKEPASTLP